MRSGDIQLSSIDLSLILGNFFVFDSLNYIVVWGGVFFVLCGHGGN